MYLGKAVLKNSEIIKKMSARRKTLGWVSLHFIIFSDVGSIVIYTSKLLFSSIVRRFRS